MFAALAFTRFAGALRTEAPILTMSTGALVIARFFAYDPYYAPYLRRMSGGILPGWWIALLAALAAAAAVASRRSPPASLFLTGAVMCMAGPTVLLAGLGH
jgi:hypothetical protein